MGFRTGPAVLLLVHRRRDLLAQTMSAIRAANPKIVYVSGDAARPDTPGDQDRVEEVWALLQRFEWGCDVRMKRQQSHGGLIHGVASGIDWFFESEESGVILEDDVLIEPSSLELASLLLEQYRDRIDVGSVTLFNSVPKRHQLHPEALTRGSQFVSSQYWGTWANRWSRYVHDPSNWREELGIDRLVQIGGSDFANFWSRKLDTANAVTGMSWETRWLYTHWINRWIVVNTNTNFSVHLGFRPDASNSFDKPSWYPSASLPWDGTCPTETEIKLDSRADRWLANQRFGLSLMKRTKHRIKAALRKSSWSTSG